MWKKHRFRLVGLLLAVIIVGAGAGSYALAQSGGGDQGAGAGGGPNIVSRHVDYNVNLQATGDLSSVDPKLAGILPLNVTASGGADIGNNNGPAVQGNLQLSGLDAIVKQFAAGSGANAAQSTLAAGLANGMLSDIQFTAVGHDLYVKLGGTWYDAGNLGRACKGAGRAGKPEGAGPNGTSTNGTSTNGSNKPHGGDKAGLENNLKNAFPGGPEALLKDVNQVGIEDIDGVSTTHTSATVDVDKALSEASAALRASGKTQQADQLDAAKSQIVGSVKQTGIDWWIDGDGNIRQVKVSFDVNPSELAPVAAAQGAQAAKAEAVLKGINDVKLDATVKFSQFGQDFQINKPDGDIKPLSDLTGFAGLAGHKKQNGQNGSPGAAWRHNGSRKPAATPGAATT